MNKHDRAKMRDRVSRVFPTFTSCGGAFEEICEVVAREVDRAIRAERRAQKLATEEANKWREEAQQRARDEIIGRFGVKL